MGLASLGGIVFRLTPDQISWNWKIFTKVDETIGGRVVQIYGAQLSDITITGSYGEQRIPGNGSDESPGRGWRLADNFVQQIHDLMAQSAPPPGVNGAYVPPKPLRFTYFSSGDKLAQGFHDYDFMVFVRSIQDASGAGAVEHKTGKFDYQYVLTLVVVKDNTTHLMDNTGPAQQTKDAAIQAALNRISNGIGWKLTRFNDQSLADGNKDGLGDTPAFSNYADDLRAAILKQGGITGITPPSGTGSTTPSTSSTTHGGTPVVGPKGSVAAPLAGDVLYSQAFGWPSGHPGIDLAQPLNSPMFAVADGIVAASGPASGFGNWIVINHPKLNVTSVYGHLYDYQLMVHVGDHVTVGQQIGEVGSNGQSTGPHLHMEIWNGTDGVSNGNNKIDGAAWLASQGITLPPLGTSGPIQRR